MNYATSQQHRDEVLERFRSRASAKYDAGQAEHGGRLWRKPVLHMLRDEISDLPFYYDVLEEQQQVVLDHLFSARLTIPRDTPGWEHIKAAMNVLEFGNAEGRSEEER